MNQCDRAWPLSRLELLRGATAAALAAALEPLAPSHAWTDIDLRGFVAGLRIRY